MNPYRESASTRPGMTIGTRCEACKKSVQIEVPNDWYDNGVLECHKKIDLYFKETIGWVRRFFHKGVDIWFCSNECAYDSYRAKEIESHWKLTEAIWEMNQ